MCAGDRTPPGRPRPRKRHLHATTGTLRRRNPCTPVGIGIRNGQVQPGAVVAVVGAGPVGLATIMTARLYGPSRVIALDLDDNRLQLATSFGASDAVNTGVDTWRDQVLAMTADGLGVDMAIEAVGIAATFQMCTSLIRPGARSPTSACTARR